jgi:hypothetical protein
MLYRLASRYQNAAHSPDRQPQADFKVLLSPYAFAILLARGDPERTNLWTLPSAARDNSR